MASWKKAVFYGGAVLVLAACSDATSPSPALNKIGGPAASYTKKAGTTATESSTSADSTNGIKTECSGVTIHWGVDGTLVPVCVPIITSY